uniref:PRA1 family protein n=1 Tax=Scylla olivacea TaxID=85551 RepID=A0A0P4WTI6_SCYOL
MDHDKDGAEKPLEPSEPREPREESTEPREPKYPTEPEKKWHWEAWEEELGEEETESESCETRDEVGRMDVKDKAQHVKALVQHTCGSLLNRPGAVADLFIVGWRCWFLFLKTLETALRVSPRSSPYALDLLCSLKNLSVPQSREEARRRVLDNYASYSGEYFWLLRSLVCFCVCRFVSPWRVGLAVVFLAVCGFVPLEDRRVGPYVMQRDLQRVFLVMVAVCGSGVVDVVSWCLLLACPAVLLHLFLHNSSFTSHRPLFSNLLRS